MKSEVSPTMLQFQPGGTLRTDSFYAVRSADEELFRALLGGEFCAVLAPRQIGKSSLRLRTEQRLRAVGARCAAIDLTRIGSRDTLAEEWYRSLVDEIHERLALPGEAGVLWERYAGTSPVLRFSRYLRDGVLAQTEAPIVLFIDEIDAVLGLSFSMDDFFAAVRTCFNDRADTAAYRRLTFCLLGAAAPSDLMQDAARTPFNIGKQIRLDDLTPEQAQVFLPGLARQGTLAAEFLSAILEWTDGHPYMTQRVGDELCRRPFDEGTSPAVQVAAAVQEAFLIRGRVEEQNLAYAEKRLRSERAERARQMLAQYQLLLAGTQLAASGDDPIQTSLRLCGLAADRLVGAQRMLHLRNRIFASVFNEQWVQKTNAQLVPLFQAGGAVRPGAVYVERSVDREVSEALLRGDSCLLWAGRWMGKTSLMTRIAERLQSRGVRTAMVNLAELASTKAKSIGNEILGLLAGAVGSDAPAVPQGVYAVPSLVEYVRAWVRQPEQTPWVFFFDELSALRPNLRLVVARLLRLALEEAAQASARHLLTLCIAGRPLPLDHDAAVRSVLSRHVRVVALADFTWMEAQHLASGLRDLGGDAQSLLQSVLDWTGGHPYQTQLLCATLVQQGPMRGLSESERVEQVVSELFVKTGAREVDRTITTAAWRLSVEPRLTAPGLSLYHRILAGERVVCNSDNPEQAMLVQSGLCAVCKDQSQDTMRPRNRIFARVCNESWVPSQSYFLGDVKAGLLTAGKPDSGYRLVREVSRSDLGPLFEGVQIESGQRVSLRELPALSSKALDVLKQELNTVKNLRHPGLLSSYELRAVGPKNFVVAEWLDGESLEACIAQGKFADTKAAIRVARQLADTLALLSTKGLVHGNLHPGSVLVVAQPNGTQRVVLVDFGLDRLVRHEWAGGSVPVTGQVLGTALYMAPEELLGNLSEDACTEVYSLGVLLFELLTGDHPFSPSSFHMMSYNHIHTVPPLLNDRFPGLPAKLSELVARMLAKQPADRPTMHFVAERLAELSESSPVVRNSESAVGTAMVVAQMNRRSLWMFVALGALVALLAFMAIAR